VPLYEHMVQPMPRPLYEPRGKPIATQVPEPLYERVHESVGKPLALYETIARPESVNEPVAKPLASYEPIAKSEPVPEYEPVALYEPMALSKPVAYCLRKTKRSEHDTIDDETIAKPVPEYEPVALYEPTAKSVHLYEPMDLSNPVGLRKTKRSEEHDTTDDDPCCPQLKKLRTEITPMTDTLPEVADEFHCVEDFDVPQHFAAMIRNMIVPLPGEDTSLEDILGMVNILHTMSEFSNEALILASIYLRRSKWQTENWAAFTLISMITAIKLQSEDEYKNAMFEFIGFSKRIINRLEIAFLSSMDYYLFVEKDTFEEATKILKSSKP